MRDYAKPYVLPHLSSIDPSVIDRILWWVSAVAVNLVLVGVATLVIKMTRRPEIPGIVQSGRNDQFAGFFVGAMKGLLAAVFVAAGIQNYAMDQIKSVTWADEQVKASWALKWSEAYQPARKIWASRPVRHIVDHIERMGLRRPGDPSEAQSGEDPAGEEVVRTASRAAARRWRARHGRIRLRRASLGVELPAGCGSRLGRHRKSRRKAGGTGKICGRQRELTLT